MDRSSHLRRRPRSTVFPDRPELRPDGGRRCYTGGPAGKRGRGNAKYAPDTRGRVPAIDKELKQMKAILALVLSNLRLSWRVRIAFFFNFIFPILMTFAYCQIFAGGAPAAVARM